VTPRDALQLTIGQHGGVADHAPLGAAERNVDDRAFPRHPRSKSAHFVEADVRRIADTAFAGSARDGMLHTIAGEELNAAVIELNRNIDGQLARGIAQNFADTFIET